ncbi:exodeoxyribonuclease V subunit beta [Nitrosomonas sp. Nm166]|uniref:UvrD-helicase domain-containing protein n=1 Tax=Nitrosomonas sp. Nm166 TaxID=1881054 RepID=UPI0008F22B5B|nr:UvrD-helicase domain-containing protein [Nitrosomonas sp. Nm166]SFD95923.1 ATP-dependent exoDNAse (exonuclease V) beta subunit (contains helicase and exonuclease domains) [Nitrosomonas sp. Nm166]
MADTELIPDADERYRALDPAQSFIVQAPAGSGKTALLIQRYLKLLACVDAPEEIVAITFTRKAAAEMRTRVLAALQVEKKPIDAETAYEKLNRELVAAFLQRDCQAGWHLIENPERLRIQTIDSLCAALTRQMPLLSKLGAQPETTEDAADFYLEAARATLEQVEQNHAIALDVERLLEHLDNDMARVETLLAEMLAQRDHWLRHIYGKTREELEASLQNSRRNALQFVFRLFPAAMHDELLALLRYAAANLVAIGKSSIISHCDQLDTLSASNVEHWCGIAELLLTKNGTWRERISANEGFPPGNTKTEKDAAKAWKNRLEILINSLSSEETLRQALHAMRQLPPPYYSDKQWEILDAITRLLPHAVAQLKIIFQSKGKVDFSEVAQRALLALGDSESPTDLALALDYRIKHLMIDEFQDTSISQFKLIEKLIAGWEAGDGRSLFVVGDPMQSIYRFREAEVGLFLQTRNVGIGNLVLQPIILRANFRSQQRIIDWVNDTFSQILPTCEDIATGAVAYAPSIGIHPALTGDAVKIHPFFEKDHAAEARQVVEIIMQTRRDDPTATIAILVRNRNHLSEIVKRIRAAGLCFRAIDIELLHHKPVVQDLLALTRVLVNPADRLAWFALLRAPWCGLLLKDIAALAGIEQKENDCGAITQETTVWELMCDESRWHAISADAIVRIRRLREVLKLCMNHRQRQSLRITVEAVWQVVGGPGCINPMAGDKDQIISSLDDARIYLDYLENREEAGNIQDLAAFERGLSELYASPDLQADDTLQIMTIHKAKGLEFDTVIVPGLGRVSRKNDKQLLKWIEQPHNKAMNGENAPIADLLLAPIQETGTGADSIYRWLDKLEHDKEQFEADRLLYVAATRAKKFLHLMGNVNLIPDTDGKLIPQKPLTGSLLSRLWSRVQSIYRDAAEQNNAAGNCQSEDQSYEITIRNIKNQNIYRLRTEWVLPAAPQSVTWQERQSNPHLREEIEFSWASEMARHVGNVAHRWLQQIAEDEMRDWSPARLQGMRNQFRQNLFADGMSGNNKEMEYAVERVILTLTNALNDKRGQWILGPQRLAQNELKISGIIDNTPVSWVIDRTFCDSNGDRWIVDYKVSSHEGSDIQGFLDREQMRYHHQLNCYAKLMQQIDSRPVRLGIYFPLICGWREW